MWQRILALEFDLRPDFPVLAKVIAIKGPQSADRLIEGGASEFALGLKMKQEVENLP